MRLRAGRDRRMGGDPLLGMLDSRCGQIRFPGKLPSLGNPIAHSLLPGEGFPVILPSSCQLLAPPELEGGLTRLRGEKI